MLLHHCTAALALAASALLTSGCTEPEPDAKPKGQILAPREAEEVGREILVKARVTGVPKGSKLVAAVETNTLLWPKEPYLEMYRDGEYSATVAEGGSPGQTFRVTVLVVDAVAQRKLSKWFEHGRKTGDFPGLKLADIGAARVDSVVVKFGK